jgi:hypothetical protein
MRSFNDLYCSPNIVQVIKARIMRWAGRVARMGERRGTYRVLMGKPEGKRPGVSGRIIVKSNSGIGMWSWLRIGTGGGHL